MDEWARERDMEQERTKKAGEHAFKDGFAKLLKYLRAMGTGMVTRRYTAREAAVVLEAKGEEVLIQGLFVGTDDNALAYLKQAYEGYLTHDWSEVHTYVEKSLLAMETGLRLAGKQWPGEIAEQTEPKPEPGPEPEPELVEETPEMPKIRVFRKEELLYREMQALLQDRVSQREYTS